MKRQGLDKAEFRLESARHALDIAGKATKHLEFYKNWSDFLSHLDAIYNCLGQSLGGQSESKIFFDRMIRDRKQDQTLNYFWHARNSDNHGIEKPAEFREGQLKVGGGDPNHNSRVHSVSFSTVPGEEFLSVTPMDDKPVRLEILPPRYDLLPVVDRGVTYQPPTVHQGRRFETDSAIEIGGFALAYFRRKLTDARSLCH